MIIGEQLFAKNMHNLYIVYILWHYLTPMHAFQPEENFRNGSVFFYGFFIVEKQIQKL